LEAIFIRDFLKLLFIAWIGAVVFPGSVSATPAKEASWLPEAAAYRLTLFLGNLEPLPWGQVSIAWSEPYRGSKYSVGALDWLDAKSEINVTRLLEAIDQQDRQALFTEATRLIAFRIEEELDRLLIAENPTATRQAVQTGRELYRAFADGVTAADPEAARNVGIAWLDLNSSAGSSGVLGAGAISSDRETMGVAVAVISDYLKQNYLVDDFAPRRRLSALPETAVLNGRTIDVPPSLPPGSDIFDQSPLPRLVLNFEEQGIDEADLPLVAYGDMLFDSAQIFGGPARDLGIACSACHNRSDVNQRLFIPGASHQPGAIDVDGAFFNPIFNDRRDDPIDIPSLRGLRFTGPYGRDGRFASLRDFTRNVVVNEFGGVEPTPFMLDALVAYMLEFDFLPNSMLAHDGRLTDAAPVAARRGEAIFNRPLAGLGERSCASCHVPQSNFLDRQAYDIGSATSPYAGARAGAFDTPTLLGTVYTAPYFHDGSLPSLSAVVDWFDETKSLGLTGTERSDLTAYLETIGAADEPYEAFDDENTAFRLAFSELTTFASTLNTLLPRRDAEHILLLTDTVAADLSADASTMSNLAARPEVYALADRLDEVGAAVRAGEWVAAETSWAAFQRQAASLDQSAF
jgi:cytochrome c peroxidase